MYTFLSIKYFTSYKYKNNFGIPRPKKSTKTFKKYPFANLFSARVTFRVISIKRIPKQISGSAS